MNFPLISIITITLNSEKYLEQTIQSVVKQSYKNKEYIVIDGASTDSTVDIIKNHASQINKWISESDKGIADAMNKGLKVATGDYILFLHSDDYLADENALEEASQFMGQKQDMFLFNLYFLDNDNKTLSRPRGLSWWMNFKTGVLHQSCICSKNLFEKLGYFDTNFKIAMDYDFFLRAYRSGIKTKYIDLPLSVMRKTGISSRLDWPYLTKRFSEEREIQLKNCNSLIMKSAYRIYWPTYLAYRLARLSFY